MNESESDSLSNSSNSFNLNLNCLGVRNQPNGNQDGSDHPNTLTTISDLLPPPFTQEESTVNEYMFESEHAALRGNEDYQNFLNDLVMFEAKRIQSLKDMNTLIDIQEKALQDPIDFVNKLQNRNDIGIPRPMEIPHPSLIEWEKYTSIPEHSIGMNRRLSIRKLCGKFENSSETTSNPDSVHDDESSCSIAIVVRGRVKDESKPETFNQLWTIEEQKRLEELLVKYPLEEVESKRYHKIASALGNRTPKQVQSRVQKYFIKLAKAGLPVPGRVPKKENRWKKIVPSLPSHRDGYYLNPSTFLQAHQPPVYMSDDDDDDDDTSNITSCRLDRNNDVSDEEDIPLGLRKTNEYRELMRLKRIRRRRHRENQTSDGATNQIQHTGYKCDRCEMNPILGTRWNCQDCPASVSVDLCSVCADSVFEMGGHDSRHRLVAIHKPLPQSHIDRDYLKFSSTCSNYLDPNFMPAT